MLGLIKKDLMTIRSNYKILIILFVIYGFLSWQGQTEIAFMLPFISVMMMISTFSYDSYNGWDAYVTTLPQGRKNSVRAKYLATLLMLATTTIAAAALAFGIGWLSGQTVDAEYMLWTTTGAVFATSLVWALMYPAIYKFGIEKARIGIFVVVFGVVIIGGMISGLVDTAVASQLFEFIKNYWAVALPVFAIASLFLSYKISERIYLNKEF